MNNKSVVIIGHSVIDNLNENEVSDRLELLINQGYSRFLCGGMGEFDMLCARCLFQLKKKYSNVKCFLVIPYLTASLQNSNYFDEIIYPDGFEKYHYKSAIIQRNRYMVNKSSVAFCYVCYNFGGATKTFNYAKKQGLQIVNMGTIQ